MGANSMMYTCSAEWTSLADVVFCDWPIVNDATDLKEIACAVIEAYGITAEHDIGGSSLGGMVALEIAVQLGIKTVYLIGSAVERREISTFLLKLVPLLRFTPLALTQYLAGKSGGVIGQMYKETSALFIKQACFAVSNWIEPVLLSQNIHRIHGAKDHVISAPFYGELVAGAGHLIAYTHPEECAQWLEELRL